MSYVECYTKRDSLIDELKKRLESNNMAMIYAVL